MMFQSPGPHDSQSLNPVEDVKTGFNLLLIVALTYAFSAKVFLHSGMGRRAFGLTSFLVLVLIPLHMSACSGGESLRPLTIFWYAYPAACLGHGLQRGRRIKMGMANMVHTYYDGRPWLCSVLPWISELTMKRTVEPFLLLLAGFLLIPWNSPFGGYVVLAAISLLITYAIEADSLRQDYDDLHDQLHAARMRAERMNGKQF